ncbi:hypothetical protein Q1W73_11365 [Asticcacaulis sp. ZE23SCel15]|jgi:hypothetical protein|uniref:hypothetical protein n=1 Tax=Asticcacaulis sp. ZE23SCel15 TaxID=3059027 RepID=UPI00265F13F2|nr:hypothetical protein [Asticcacaulis sp. ZE23SCel15]WKL56289.1 hypothetical protein Q1W73_11365 [Asticcacaulis sp. ZE23SCel15]
MAATGSQNNNMLMTILAVAVIAIIAVAAIFMMQDNRSSGERVADAVTALPQGVDNAANELGDQSPAENIERNAEKAAEKVN